MKKRIALSAVVALAAGLLAAVPASAVAPAAVVAPTDAVGAIEDYPFATTDTALANSTAAATMGFVAQSVGVTTKSSNVAYTTLTQTASPAGYVKINAVADAKAITVLGAPNTSAYVSSVTVSATGGTATLTGGSTYCTIGGTTSAFSSTVRLIATSLDQDAECAAVTGNAFATYDSGASAGYIKVPTTAAGTTTVTVTANVITAGVSSSFTVQVYTIVVGGGTSYGYSRVSAPTPSDADVVIDALNKAAYMPKTANADHASYTVTQYDNANGSPAAAGLLKDVTATITGVGSFSDASTGISSQYAVVPAAASTGADGFNVYADGRAGKATVTFTVGGTVVATRTVYFYGNVTTVEATQNYAIIAAGVVTAPGVNVTVATTAAGEDPFAAGQPTEFYNPDLVFVAKDANGTPVPITPAVVAVSSSDATVVSGVAVADAMDDGQSDYSQGLFSWGVAAQTTAVAASGKSSKVTITVSNADGTSASAAATFTIGGAPKTVTLSFDKATYSQGEKAVLTITAKDASGNAAADGSAPLASLTSNVNFGGALPTAATTILGGKKAITLYAPAAAGTWTLTGKDANLAAITVSATVASAADVAANAAAVAALQTSVAALQTTVASLVASLTAQIKVINSALAKIAKKLKVKI